MTINRERFEKDLERLIDRGELLEIAMQEECFPGAMLKVCKDEKAREELAEALKNLPKFRKEYQGWYSEAIVLLRQLLPDRVPDFIRLYEKPKARKNFDSESYRIEDYLQGLVASKGEQQVVGRDAAIPLFLQQLAMVTAAKARFKSSLFEIRHLVQADLFDSELEAAEGLVKYKFVRAAGALAGVVLEGHLAQVCSDRTLVVKKTHPAIADLNEVLKSAGVIDVPTWRFIQHLADIRNLCDHSRKPDPTGEQVADLIAGVKKVIKTIV
jgi:hypothetical protein